VEDLFFNVPARRKFLRSDRTERRHVDGWVTRYAMAYPQLRFTLSHGGRVTFQSSGNGSLRDVLVAVYGLEVGAAALEISPDDGSPGRSVERQASGSGQQTDAIRVKGFVSPPSLHRANRGYITLFVNGRWVRDASLTYAVVQAYHTLLPKGRYPLAVVMVNLPSGDVDVNVHPAKAEVRFRDGDAVFRAVQKTVRHTLLEQSPVPAVRRSPTARIERHRNGGIRWPDSAARWGGSERERGRERLAGLRPQSVDGQLRFEERPSSAGAPGEGAFVSVAQKLPPLRVVGQLGVTYIVAEGPAGMYLIDQHAAHERVLFERLLAERERAEVASQALLEPEPVDLAPEAADLLEEHLEVLNSLGFQVECFGGRTMLVRALPVIVAQVTPDRVLEDVAAALDVGDVPLSSTVEEAVARRVCKQAAIKAGQVMAQAEMEELVRALEQCTNPRTCPHGRPTMIHLSVEQLAREFGRGGP